MAVRSHDNGSRAQMLLLLKQWLSGGVGCSLRGLPPWIAADASAPWVASGTADIPGAGPPLELGPAALALSGSGSASSGTKRPRLCLGMLVLVLDLPLGFLYSDSVIIVIWPQIQWHPADPAAGLGRLQVQPPSTSLWSFLMDCVTLILMVIVFYKVSTV